MERSHSSHDLRPIKLVDIELSEPINAIKDLDRYIALKSLVRLHGDPLGYVQLGITNGYCSARAITKAVLDNYGWDIIQRLVRNGLSEPLDQEHLCLDDLLDGSPSPYSGPFPLVTAVVCTRDRTKDLTLCLDALIRLDYPNLEILVIDNAPSDNQTEQLVLSQYPTIQYVKEPRPGLSWARNRAILEANGEIIAFTDDDVIVDSGWITAFARVFTEDKSIMAATGLVVPYELETDAQILFEYHGGFGRGFKPYCFQAGGRDPFSYLGTGKFGTGANMAFRRAIFNKLGLFDTALGVGTPTKGGEDIEIFFRFLHEGYTLAYEPTAFVRHRHRRSYSDLQKQIRNNAVALSSYHVRSGLAYPKLSLAFTKLQIWWLWHWHLKRMIQAFTRPHRFPRDLVVTEFVGYLEGIFRYPQAKRHAEKIVQKFGDVSLIDKSERIELHSTPQNIKERYQTLVDQQT